MSQQQQTQPQGLESFDENTRRELQQFLEQEQTKARIQTQIHEFTDTCWDLCIKGQPQSRFSRGEQACLANCTDRFLDASLFIVKSLEERKGHIGGLSGRSIPTDVTFRCLPAFFLHFPLYGRASAVLNLARQALRDSLSAPRECRTTAVLMKGTSKAFGLGMAALDPPFPVSSAAQAAGSSSTSSLRPSPPPHFWANERPGGAVGSAQELEALLSVLEGQGGTDSGSCRRGEMASFAHSRSASSPSILAPIPLRPLSLVSESDSPSHKSTPVPDERFTLFASPTRPVLAVIQPPSGSRTQNGGQGSILAGPSARGRHDVIRSAQAKERERDRRGHQRGMSDGAILRSLTPLPTFSPVPPPPSPPLPLLTPLSKSTTAPSLPSPLTPVSSSCTPVRRGRSPSIRRSSSSPSLPSSSASSAPRRYPLSRRYTRSASLSHLSSRSPVQDRSIPQLSHLPLLDPPVQSDSSTPADPSRTPSPTPQQQLFESLVCATLERRLADRLAKASGQTDGGKKLAEKAGLAGLRAGREMLLWGAIRRVREAEQRRSASAPTIPQLSKHGKRRSPSHIRSSSSPAVPSRSSTSPLPDAPMPVSSSPARSITTTSHRKYHSITSLSSFPPHNLMRSTSDALRLHEDDETPLSFLVTVRVQLPTSPAPAFTRWRSSRLSRPSLAAHEDLTVLLQAPSTKGYRRSILGVKLPRLPKKAARFEETVNAKPPRTRIAL